MTVRRGIGEWQPGIVAGRTCRTAGADPDPLCGESSAAEAGNRVHGLYCRGVFHGPCA